MSFKNIYTSTKKDRQCTCNITLRRIGITSVAVQKQLNITYSECAFVVLVIQHAKCMRRIILSFVACLDLPYFSTLSHTQYDCRKKVTEYKMCVLVFPTTFASNISHSKKN
jgi:hypothetical protein